MLDVLGSKVAGDSDGEETDAMVGEWKFFGSAT
jgi:hypothetical protein